METLPEIFDRVSPAVVSISATSINPYRLSERVSHIAGSGVLIDASGLILTNAHVAFGRQSITVTLDNGYVKMVKPAAATYISSFPPADQIIGDLARVSAPENQGKDAAKLIASLIRRKEWSPLEMADMCVEIYAERDVTRLVGRRGDASIRRRFFGVA